MSPASASARGAAWSWALLAVLAGVGCHKSSSPAGPGSNRAPEIRNVLVSPPSVRAGGSASVRVEAVDPDGDALFYRFAAEAGTLVPDPQDPSRATYTIAEPGTRSVDRITVLVVDARNATSTFRASVGLLGNEAPRVRIDAGRSSCHPAPECTISLTAVAQDSEGDLLNYVWGGCATGTGRTANCRVRAVGPATAVVTVEDSRGGVSSATTTVGGANADPQVNREGGELRPAVARLLIQPSDPDGDDVTCAWRGDCLCRGDFQSFNANCEVPVGVGGCVMLVYCWDRWGGLGESRFRLQR